jgi:hypothetical protein
MGLVELETVLRAGLESHGSMCPFANTVGEPANRPARSGSPTNERQRPAS